MWKNIVDYSTRLVSVVQKQKKHEEDIKTLTSEVKKIREEFRDLTRVVERLAYEIQRDRDKAEADKRILLLEIENRFLRGERSLPPAPPANDKTE